VSCQGVLSNKVGIIQTIEELYLLCKL